MRHPHFCYDCAAEWLPPEQNIRHADWFCCRECGSDNVEMSFISVQEMWAVLGSPEERVVGYS